MNTIKVEIIDNGKRCKELNSLGPFHVYSAGMGPPITIENEWRNADSKRTVFEISSCERNCGFFDCDCLCNGSIQNAIIVNGKAVIQ